MAKRAGLRWKSVGLKDGEQLTAGCVHHRWPAWSADGRWVAFAAGADAEAAWVVTDRRGRVARTIAGVAAPGAAFGPDGALAFGRRVGAGAEIWMTASPALPPMRLLGGDGQLYQGPAFSPDGRLLAYAAADGPDAPSHLHILELASGQRHALFEEPGRADTRPVFSPDGEELFFEGAEGEDVAVFALRFANHALERISPMRLTSRRPAPLSRELVVVERATGAGSRLVLIDRRERRERELSLEDDARPELHDPCAHLGKSGKVRLAFTQLVSDGELNRHEVCVARLRGVGAAEELDEPSAGPATADESGEIASA